jgi:hypothetical protein
MIGCDAVRRFLVVALACALGGTARSEELRAALGSAALPAQPGTALAGYGGIFERRAEEVLDVPEARALLLERGDLRVALVAFDLLLIRPELRARLLESEAARGLDGLILVATHSHSGPGGYVPGWLAGRVTGARHDPGAAARLADAGSQALAEAAATLAPARIASARASLALAENRRRPSGPRETALELVRFDRAGGPPLALVAYAAHPTVLSPRNRAVSADFPGALRRWLDARGWSALFVQGPLGDQQPDSRLAPPAAEPGEVEARHVEAVGAALGSATAAALAPLSTQNGVSLRFAEREVDAPAPRLRRGCALWWFAPLVRPALRRLASPRVRFQALQVGEARFVFLPAEPTAEVGAALRSATGAAPVALANDWISYVVSASEYARGGYEACMSFAGPDGADWLAREAARAAALLEAAP